MTEDEVLADLVGQFEQGVRSEIEALSEQQLAWRGDPGGNSIGVTVWHCARWMDVLAVRILEDRPAEEEIWQGRGWRDWTGYDPRGIGYRGLGVLTGYTAEEVEAIPTMSAGDLLYYLQQACESVRGQLLSRPNGSLQEGVSEPWGEVTRYQWVTSILTGCLAHLGEIEALRAMRDRVRAPSSPSPSVDDASVPPPP